MTTITRTPILIVTDHEYDDLFFADDLDCVVQQIIDWHHGHRIPYGAKSALFTLRQGIINNAQLKKELGITIEITTNYP